MKISKHFEEIESNLLKEADVVNESCQWWEQEIEKSLLDLEAFNKKETLSSGQKKKVSKIFKKIEYLLSRVEFEQANIDKIEEKIDNYLSLKEIILKR